MKAWLVEGCRDGCPSGRFSHLHRGTLELCQSDHQVLGHLPDQGSSPQIAQFARVVSSRKIIGSSKLLPFKNDGGHSVLGGLLCCRNVFVPFPRSVPWQSRLGALRTIPSTSWLGFCSDMHGQLSTTLYRQGHAFQILSNQLNVTQVDSNQVVGWSMETGCTWA